MSKYKVFISSVQKEFEKERLMLQQYLQEDALLGGFFVPYLFEADAAAGAAPDVVYLDEVAASDIYIGLLGAEYGYEDDEGVSPTEREFDLASSEGLSRWMYIKGDNTLERHPKEVGLIDKVRGLLSYKRYSKVEDLREAVYNSCVKYLKEMGHIHSDDFDNSLHAMATLDAISVDRVRSFVRVAREKRAFPLRETATVTEVLQHLHMMRGDQLVNSAMLVFSDTPQAFFPAATVKCAHFHGTTVTKPIPDLKVFDGTVYEMADEAVDFVLSKISISSGTRAQKNQVDTQYEIPREVIAEAIINAIAHRDYTSKSSVEVSVYADRVEIYNAGEMPDELDTEKLKVAHGSYPPNPLLAECMFQMGDIERYGTGMIDIFQKPEEAGLRATELDLSEGWKVILWRPSSDQVTDQVKTPTHDTIHEGINDTDQVTDQVSDHVKGATTHDTMHDTTHVYKRIETLSHRVVLVLDDQLSRSDIMSILDLRNRSHFAKEYLEPALSEGLIEMTIPDKPKSKKQKYRLTQKGFSLQKKLRS